MPPLRVQITARVIDGLGRPLSNATVEVEMTEKGEGGKVAQVHRLKMSSDQDGLVNWNYDETKISKDDFSVEISKAGYTGYSTGLRAEYVQKRRFVPRDLRRVARLAGEFQKIELQELLAGAYEFEAAADSLEETVFVYYRELAPALRGLLADPRVGTSAAQLLSFVGAPADLRLIVREASRKMTLLNEAEFQRRAAEAKKSLKGVVASKKKR